MDRAYHSLPTTASHSSTKTASTAEEYDRTWQLSPEELEVIVKKIVEETGASSMKDMGRVMGLANKELAGKADGKAISVVVKQLLSN